MTNPPLMISRLALFFRLIKSPHFLHRLPAPDAVGGATAGGNHQGVELAWQVAVPEDCITFCRLVLCLSFILDPCKREAGLQQEGCLRYRKQSFTITAGQFGGSCYPAGRSRLLGVPVLLPFSSSDRDVVQCYWLLNCK